MGITDVEYLLQVEDREAVIRTLQAKIQERDQELQVLSDAEYALQSQQNLVDYDTYLQPGYSINSASYDQHEYMADPQCDLENERDKLGLIHRNLKM